jgi:magnesium transporter
MSFNFLPRRQQGSLPQGSYRYNPNDLRATTTTATSMGVGGSNHHRHTLRSNPKLTTSSLISAAETLVDRQQQIPELLVFELHQDGSSKYRTLSIRGLYRYVLNCITHVGPAVAVAGSTKSTTTSTAPTTNLPTEATSTTNTTTPIPEDVSHHERVDPVEPNGIGTTATQSSSSSSPPIPQPTKLQRRAVTVSSTPAPSMQPPPHHPHVTYRERLGGYLHPRDMRRLVTPFSTTNEPELIVRRHVMLLNFDPLRAIILRDRVLVLVPDGADSILVRLERRVRGGSSELVESFFGSNNGKDEDDEEEVEADFHKINVSQHSQNSNSRVHNWNPFKRSNSNSGDHGPQESFHSNDASSQPHQEDMIKSTTAAPTEMTEPEDEDMGDDNDGSEWLEMEATEWTKLPFELQCADAVLHVVCDILTQDTLELQKASERYIDRVLNAHGLNKNDDPLAIIRVVKDAVQLMSARVKGFVQSMNRILDEDEDMALMNLSRLLTHPERFIQPVTREVLEEESDEPEIILESNLQVGLTLLNYLDLIQGQVQTAKELIDQKQDQVRNRLLFANMMLNALMLSVTIMAVVGGFFGMNVPNGRQDDPTVFREIVFGSLAGSTGLCLLIMTILFYGGTIPRSSGGNSKDIEL